MKKLFLFFAALVVMLPLFSNSNAQPLQDFESLTFPPTGWTLEFTGTQRWSRQAYTSYLPPQTGSSKFDFFNAAEGVTQSLVSPTLNPSTSTDSLKFNHSYRTYTGGEVDTLVIETSSNNGANYTVLITLIGSPTVGVGMTTRLPSTSSAAPTLTSEWGAKVYSLPVGTNKIRFKAISDFGNNLYLDNIRTTALATALTNDIAASSIDVPTGTIQTGTSYVPKATFSNVGTANQGSVPVKCLITGPVNFTGTTSISINSGASTQATFSSPVFTPTVGSYNVTVISELGSDQNRANDTARSVFTVVQSNYGPGTAGIFFANSIATGAPSKPEVCWPDYSGGTTLCLDGTNNASAIFTGSLDDGYWKIGSIFPAGYHVRINGVNYDSIFPGTNGIVGLTNNTNLTDFSPGTLPDALQTVALYPFWKDLHFIALQGNTYIKYMVRGTRLYIFWLGPTYNAGLLSLDRIFFGAFIELVNGSVDSKVTYQYGDLSKGTTASFVAAYNNNTLADHVIGSQSGASYYLAYRERVTTLTKIGPMFSTPAGGELAVAIGPNAGDFGDKKCNTLNVTLNLQKCPSDTITVSIYDASTCGLIDTKKAYFTGSGSFSVAFAGVRNSPVSYYMKVQQKNSLAMWSNPFSFTGGAASYNFTTAQSQEIGGNQLFNGSLWSMISGDVNQDGAIDGSDLAAVENDVQCGVPGCISGYPTDLNCDDFVDASDLASAENNQGYFEAPPCAPAPSDQVIIYGPEDRQIFLPEVDKTNEEAVKLYESRLRNNSR